MCRAAGADSRLGEKTYFFWGKIGQNHLDEGPEWRKRKNTLSLETRDYLEVNFNCDGMIYIPILLHGIPITLNNYNYLL